MHTEYPYSLKCPRPQTYTIWMACSFILLFAWHEAMAQGGHSDVSEMNLTGSVASVHETYYKAKSAKGIVEPGSQINRDDMVESITKFDDAGMKIGYYCLGVKGDTVYYALYGYDAISNLTAEESHTHDGKIHNTRYLLEYEWGRVRERTMLRSDGNVERRDVMEYDSTGILKSVTSYRKDSSMLGKTSYRYHDIGLAEIIESDAAGITTRRITYGRDSEGRVLDETWYGKDNKFIIRYKYEYNEKGFQSSITWLKENGKVMETWTSEYQYDAYSNWVRQVQYRNKKPKTVIAREIVMFQ